MCCRGSTRHLRLQGKKEINPKRSVEQGKGVWGRAGSFLEKRGLLAAAVSTLGNHVRKGEKGESGKGRGAFDRGKV